ncbi:MAG: lysylphosphatidylglycerol synthase transmembrane domain-containing protein [Planctomycetota bacterium]
MKAKDPRRLKAALLITALAALSGLVLSFRAAPDGGSPRPELAWACLLLMAAPAAVVSLLRFRAVPTLRVTVAAGLMAYLFFSGRIDLGAMLACRDRWGWLLAGGACILTQPFIAAARWRWLLAVQEIRLSYLQSLRLTLVGFFFNTCLPGATGGDLFRAYAISRSAHKTAEAIVAVLLDRLTGLAALIGFCGAGLVLNLPTIVRMKTLHKPAWFMTGLLIGATLLLFFLFNRALAERLRRSRLGRVPLPGRAGIGRAYRALHAYHGSRKTLLAACGISLLGHVSSVLAAISFAAALGVEGLSLRIYLLLVPLGLMFNSIPVTPGGVGQGQAAFAYLFKRALPGAEGAAGLGGALMTFLHLSFYSISAVGALVYASGYHTLSQAASRAEASEASEGASPGRGGEHDPEASGGGP